MARKEYLSIGKILGTRGLLGELKVESWCDTLEDFCNIKKMFLEIGKPPLDVISMRIHKSNILLKLKSVTKRSEAESLKDKVIYAYRDDIPLSENRYFIEELKGCNVLSKEGKIFYGMLEDVTNTGSNDIYIIKSTEGKEYLVPIIPGTILKVDLEENYIYINPIQGIFDDD